MNDTVQPEWQIIGGMAAIIAAFTAIGFGIYRLVTGSADKALTLREHVEFKDSTRHELETIKNGQANRLLIKTFDDWREMFRHDVDRVERMLTDMQRDMTQRVESREMVQTFQAKHDELQRAITRLQSQLDVLQDKITGVRM